MQQFWERVNTYAKLSEASRLAWEGILQRRVYDKNEFFLQEGQIPRTVAFVEKGLLSQYFQTDDGSVIIKRFFPEQFFVASLSALLQNAPSQLAIKTLEPTILWEYNFAAFKQLTALYPDMASMYMRYLEVHWVIEKEPMEISLRHDTARTRYLNFLKTYPKLESRLKQHEVASYLGVTPTQLSRIRSELWP